MNGKTKVITKGLDWRGRGKKQNERGGGVRMGVEKGTTGSEMATYVTARLLSYDRF